MGLHALDDDRDPEGEQIGVLQPRAHGLRVGPAVDLVKDEGPVDHLGDSRRDVLGERSQSSGLHAASAYHHLLHRLGVVHEMPRNEREHGGADGPEVAPAVDLGRLAERLFRGHERRRADDGARSRGALPLGALQEARDAEVEHLERSVLGQKQVLGLDVPVDDAFLVGRGEHLEQSIGEHADLPHRQEAPHLLASLVEGRSLE